MVEASAACSAAGSQQECPQGSRCWGLGQGGVSMCWPDCTTYECVGECDVDGSCIPVEGMACDPECGSYCGGGGPGPDDPGEGGPAVDHCVEEGSGPLLHDNIADFQLRNCNGDWVSLHDYCGSIKALWIVAVAGWCGACSAYLPQIAEIEDQARQLGRSLRAWIVLGADSNDNPPSQAFCQGYATRYDLDPTKVFYDAQWETLFGHVFPYLQNDTLLLPWEALLDGDNMEYVYHSPPGGGRLDMNTLNAVLDD